MYRKRRTTMAVHIIGEAGTNHNGSLATALNLADAARRCGADSVKFQMIIPGGLYLPSFYQDGRYAENEVFQKRQKAMLKTEDFAAIAARCRETGIGFGCSIFDLEGLKALDGMDPSFIKIASVDLNNSRLLLAAAERRRKLIVSTGMSSLGEIERAVADLSRVGNVDLVLMHCVSVYPAATSMMNLSMISLLRSAFGYPVGLSDHTENSLAGAMAVALGATCIEKHLTLNRKDEGFDHAYAMEPEALRSYIDDMRQAEQACRQQLAAKVGDKEREVRKRARRGLYAARDLAEGETLAEKDVLVVRPENTLAPNDLEELLGKRLRQKVLRYQSLAREQFAPGTSFSCAAARAAKALAT
jgi:N,N'-diacetyllegionaminate synthase